MGDKIKIEVIKNGCNGYLVESEKTAILIDPGLNGRKDWLLKRCQEKKVSLILLTHGHMDHIQCVAELAHTLHIPIAMNEKDEALIEDNLSQAMHGRGIRGKILSFFSKLSTKASHMEPFKIDIPLNDEKVYTHEDLAIEVIKLPGHTKGSIGFKIGDHVFVGDALMNMFHPEISLLYDSAQDLENSARKIQVLGKCRIHFGHGEDVENRQWI